jgi:hypothetical protein
MTTYGIPQDADELLLGDLAVAIAVSHVHELLELLIGHATVLAELLQVLGRDLAGLVVCEHAEDRDHLLPLANS